MKRKSEQLLFQENSNSSSSKPSPSSGNASPSHRSSPDYDCDSDLRDRDINGDKEREKELDSEQRNHNTEHDEEQLAVEKSRLEKINNAKQELEAIKHQYLRSKKPRIRVIKPMQKLRFTFNWVYTMDTVRDVDILRQNPKEARTV